MMFEQIAWPEARRLLDEEGGQLVDVRNTEEFARGSLPEAVNIPLHLLPYRNEELDRQRPVVLFCATGARSMQGMMLLQQLGFEAVHNLGSIQKGMVA